jgi:hypothetical protein
MFTTYVNFPTIRDHVRIDNPKTIIWYAYTYDQIYMKDPVFKVVVILMRFGRPFFSTKNPNSSHGHRLEFKEEIVYN